VTALDDLTPEQRIAEARALVAYDWIVSRAWNRLHFVDLSDDQLLDMFEYRQIWSPLRLACGRTAAYVSIPGVFTRMGAMRCLGCCRAKGYPPGKGSPTNDPACRELLGLPT
jgi:hypothetical protein